MFKLSLLHFYIIATLLFSTSIFGSEISFCDRTPFPELCRTIFGLNFESRESSIKESINQAHEALGNFLVMARTVFDGQAKGWTDCLELYEDARHHLNISSHMNPTHFQKWLTEALVKHQACQSGFSDSNLSSHLKHLVFVLQNFSKTLVDLLEENKPLGGKILTTDEHKMIQIADFSTPQANFVVAQDGSGAFKTVSEAVQAAKQQRIGTDRFVIYVKAGVYDENVLIDESLPNLTLMGDGINVTIITNDKNTDEKGYSTYDTATVQVWAAGFVAVGITFENRAGPGKQQAVALLSASDQSAFYKCSFKGYQDTLCLLRHRQFYRECDIYGTIDFIFGDAAAVLQKCNIYVQKPEHGQQNTITAQGRTDPNAPTGFIIHNSRVIATTELAETAGSVRTFLGRPWKDYSRVVFVMCFLDGLIDPEGWMPFPGSSAFDTIYYAEYKNNGKGADTAGRVKWPGYHVLTTDEEVEQYSVRMFLGGDSWIPATGVPFNTGLF